MHRLYWFLLRLLPGSFRQPFAGIEGDAASVDQEMYGVFLEASSEVRTLGILPYVAFCAREIGGLLTESFSHRTSLSRWVLYPPAGAVTGLLLAFVITLFLGPEMYTSTAVLQETVPLAKAPYLTARPQPPVEALLTFVLTHNNFVNVIQNYGLYQDQRNHSSIDNLVERMRKDLTIESGKEAGILVIRYRNPDRFLAQKVALDFVSRVIAERIRDYSSASGVQNEFLTEQTSAAGKEWDRLYTELHSTAAGPLQEQLRSQVDSARVHYQALQIKLAEARSFDAIGIRKIGKNVEMLDPASLPFTPDLSHWKIYIVCLLTGALAGMMFPFLARRRSGAAIPSGDIA